MIKKYSFIFPVYKKGNIIENILKILEDPYPSELKEIIISVDCPTEEFLNKLRNFMHLENVKIIISSERRGKVASVNDAVTYATGDIFIFLDSDVEIENINLNELLKDFEEADIVEFYKRVEGKRILGKLYEIEFNVYYEIIQPYFSKKRKNIFLNGSGFGIKRNVWEALGGYTKTIIEDADLATRAYSMNYSYKLTKNISLKVESIDSFKKWLDQKKRWLSGGLEWFLIHVRTIINFISKDPAFIGILLLLNPSIIYFLFTLITPYFLIYSISKSIYTSLVNRISFFYLFVLSIETIHKFIYYFIYIISMFAFISFLLFLAFLYKRKLGNPLYIMLFVIFYSSIQSILLIYITLYYLLFEGYPKFNWKV
ncbi:MAG: glycosyltransferase family 2 protein [Nanopusillaceae archaeon]